MSDKDLIAKLILEDGGEIIGALHQDMRNDINRFHVRYPDGEVCLITIKRTNGEYVDILEQSDE